MNKRQTACRILDSIIIFAMVFGLLSCDFAKARIVETREPAVSGSFYPADPKTLSDMVEGFMQKADYKPVDGKLYAVIAPHAGYIYSGQVAAYSYTHLFKERKIKTVILIGPSHYGNFSGASVYADGAWKTPLGTVAIDSKLAKSLLSEENSVSFLKEPYKNEHSLEVQLPFLQNRLKDFKIVPIIIGGPSDRAFRHLTDKLTEMMKRDDGIVMVVSTDLSHYYEYKTAVSMDSKLINGLERFSSSDVERYLMTKECEMCGAYPVMLAMGIVRNLGANQGVTYKYMNSGDVTGETAKVVGYVGLGFYKTALKADEKTYLLKLARNTVEGYILKKNIPTTGELTPKIQAQGAVFVTIKKKGALRGCIGNIMPVIPLSDAVEQNAISASVRDPRFQPLVKSELPELSYEVSVLSSMETVLDMKEIQVGRDGLFVTNDYKSGLLLPQVATDYGWNTDTFFKEVCLKATMSIEECRKARLYKFSAEVVSE